MKNLMLLLLRYVPVVGALCCACNSLLSYAFVDAEWLGYFMCAAFLVAWAVLALYFRFCIFYFILILYILVCETLNTVDFLVGIPISDKGLFVLHCGLAGITFLSAAYAHVRHNKRTKRFA